MSLTLEHVLLVKTMVRLTMIEEGIVWRGLDSGFVSTVIRRAKVDLRKASTDERIWLVHHVRRAYGMEYEGDDGQFYNTKQEGPRDTVPTRAYSGSDARIRAYEIAESGEPGDGGEPGADSAMVADGGARGVGGI